MNPATLGYAVHSKALLFQGVHLLHNNALVNCSHCLWSAHFARSLMHFRFLQLPAPGPHCFGGVSLRCFKAEWFYLANFRSYTAAAFFLEHHFPDFCSPWCLRSLKTGSNASLSQTVCCFLQTVL